MFASVRPRDVCADFWTGPAEFNGEDHHVHLRVNLPPKIALPGRVTSLKGVPPPGTRTGFPEPTARSPGDSGATYDCAGDQQARPGAAPS